MPCPIAWLLGTPLHPRPQAAIGGMALDAANAREGGPMAQEVAWGQQVLTLAVLSILVTAPVGAVLIAVGGPRLLAQEGAVQGQAVQEMPAAQGENKETAEETGVEGKEEDGACVVKPPSPG